MLQDANRPRASGGAASESAAALGTQALAAAEIARAQLSRIAGLDTGQAAAPTLGTFDIVERAKAELSRITGQATDHVSGVRNEADGWHVTVDLIELKRIPASTDVLAVYEAVYTPAGSLLSYQRTRRYYRDQMMNE